MKYFKIKSFASAALLASLTSFAAGCYYYDGYGHYDYARGDRYDRDYDRWRDRHYDYRYDHRYDWRYGRYYDDRYARRNGERDRDLD